MAKKADKSEDKGKKDKKGKKGDGEQATGASVANHPRARAAPAREAPA